jgi:hypothetical protein
MIEIEKVIDNHRILYFKKGTNILHREDGPAIEYETGLKEWFFNGERHRDDGPAMLREAIGYEEWIINGKHHRLDGPAIKSPFGGEYWYKNELLHREDGPAVIGDDGKKEWYINGKCHREDGPAVIHSNGKLEWWLNHLYFSKERWFKKLSKAQKEKMFYSEYFIGS